MILLNEYSSDDLSKVAKLYADTNNLYIIEFFKGEYMIGVRFYDNRTLRYAEDAAENYVQGILTEEEVRDE